MRFIFTMFIIFGIANGVFAQKRLYLDNGRKPQKLRWGIGAEIHFKLKGDEKNAVWYEETIKDIDIERNWLVFDTWHCALDSIEAVRDPNAKRWIIGLGKGLQGFGISGAGYGSMALLFKREGGKELLSASIIAYPVGWLMTKIRPYRTYKIGKRTRLWKTDLTLPKDFKNPANA
jgi:hypothetical protein